MVFKTPEVKMAQTTTRRGESSDEMGEDNTQEMELTRLRKQLRGMEIDRKAYVEDASNILRKQEAEIESLLKENEEIQTILRLVQSERNEGLDATNAAQLSKLIEEVDGYHKEVEQEKSMLSALDIQILTVEKQILHQRKKPTGPRVRSASSIRPICKRLNVMENRLHKATVMFNQQLANNAKLRAEIDDLRQEKNVFDNLYKRLSRQFEELKKEKTVVIQEATQAYEERYEAQNKMVTLRERVEKDEALNESEMKELERVIHQDNKLKEFMIAKAQDRAFFKAEEEAKKSKGHEQELNHSVEKQIIESYEEAFSMIKEITGEDDLENIVNNFIQKEDENFALFNYVNELNDETEQLQEEVNTIKKNIVTFREDNIKLDEERKQFLKELEIRTNRAAAEADELEKAHTQERKTLEELKGGIATLFKIVDCDPSMMREMLGSVDEVTDKNVMQYLGVVEQKALEMLHIYQYLDMKVKKGTPQTQTPTSSPGMPGEEAPRAPTTTSNRAPSIMPPSLGGTDDVSDDDNEELNSRPFTREELSQLVLQNLNRPRTTVSSSPNATPNRTATIKDTKKKPTKK